MKEAIIEALKKLDVDNDAHWTGEGMPLLDVVKDFAGFAVSRADVTSACKTFTRKTPEALTDFKPELTSEGELVDGNSESAKEGTDTEENSEDEVDTGPEETPEGSSEAEVAARKELKAARVEALKANQRLRSAQQKVDEFIIQREKVEKAASPALAIQAYQKAELKRRLEIAQGKAKQPNLF